MKIYLGAVGSTQAEKTLLPDMERTITETYRRIERAARTTSARRVLDVIAVKRTVEISHRVIKEADLDTWKAFWLAGGTLEIEIERERGSFDKYPVEFEGDLGARYWKKNYHPYMGWLYQGVTVTLVEQ